MILEVIEMLSDEDKAIFSPAVGYPMQLSGAIFSYVGKDIIYPDRIILSGASLRITNMKSNENIIIISEKCISVSQNEVLYPLSSFSSISERYSLS